MLFRQGNYIIKGAFNGIRFQFKSEFSISPINDKGQEKKHIKNQYLVEYIFNLTREISSQYTVDA